MVNCFGILRSQTDLRLVLSLIPCNREHKASATCETDLVKSRSQHVGWKTPYPKDAHGKKPTDIP
jgi:hypothetical protein